MRRLLVFCAVGVMMFAAFAAVGLNRVASVSAAGGSGNLVLFQVQTPGGCPLGPAYTFCDQVTGTTGPAEVFFVNNTSAVTKLSVALAPVPGLMANFAPKCTTTGPCDFAITANSCTGMLAANMQCEISVASSPTVGGLRAAALTVTDAEGDTLAINIQGTGKNLAMAPPKDSCTVADNAFTYCNEPVGGASAAETFTLTTGTPETGVTISLQPVPGLSSEFGATDFTISGTICTGVLAANGSCTVDVEFTPKAAGLRSAALTATDADGDTTVIYLAGSAASGLAFEFVEPGTNPATCARANFFGFCNEPPSGSTAAAAFTLTNTSGTQVTGITIVPPVSTTQSPPPPGNFTVTSTSCTSTLAANSSCVVNVAFTPLTTGLQQGAISVTDTQGDVAAFNLAGTGDDFSMQIVAGQSPEVSVAQGGTATFMAQLNADAVFGQNGEKVTLACPINLPTFTNCSFKPCPITPTIGGNIPFSIVIVTSSSTVPAPEIQNPCNTAAANVAPGTRGPNGILRVLTNAPKRVPLFPALLAVLALASLLGFAAMPRSNARALRVHVVFAAALLSAALVSACGGSGATKFSTATPVAVTIMNVTASATDSSGNPINASRGLQITLDVIKGP
ncbi:MAG: choice-of-anchor D domain-containing protein [Candidatus Acidoferrales bacterium]|nr:choice-of-anchor D domain-containing protein [Candidatus Acidoferrales bacterium]